DFAKLDANGDGKVTPEEMRAAMKAHHEHMRMEMHDRMHGGDQDNGMDDENDE
ncbi:MAG: calcium-binding protein, partial [Alphaproteobacteria bacterium]